MTISAQLFDGTELQFPDGTSDDVVAKAAAEQTKQIKQAAASKPAPAAPPAAPLPRPSAASDYGLNSAQPAAAAPPAPTAANPTPATDPYYDPNGASQAAPQPSQATPAPAPIAGTPAEGTASPIEDVQRETGDQTLDRMLKNAGGSAMEKFAQMGGAGSVIAAAPLVLLDKFHSLVTGKDQTALQDWGFKGADMAQSAREYWAPDPKTAPTVVDKLVNGLASMGPDLMVAASTGGGATVTKASATAYQAAEQMILHGMKSMSLPAFNTGITKASDLIKEGVPIDEAVNRGLVAGATTAVTGGLPMAAGGAKLLTRVGQGAATGAATGEVSRQAENLVTAPERQQPFDATNLGVEALTGATMAGTMAHPGAPGDGSQEATGYQGLTNDQAAQQRQAAATYQDAANKGFIVNPPLVSDTPDVQRKKTMGVFQAAVAKYGIDPDAAKRAAETAAGLPLEQVGPFLARLTGALQKRNLVGKPVEPHAVDALTAGPIEDPKIAAQRQQDAENAASEQGNEAAGSGETAGETEGVTRGLEPMPPDDTIGSFKATGDTTIDNQSSALAKFRKDLADAQSGTVSREATTNSPAGRIKKTLGLDVDDGEPAPAAKPAEPVAEPQITSPVDAAAHTAAHSVLNDREEPTVAQQKAGNYQKGHPTISGIDISIENPEGSTRRSHPDAETPWQSTMTDGHYGDIRGTIGMDGEPIDTFVKPGTPADYKGDAFIVDQVAPESGKPDEHKVMLGYGSREEAAAAYHANYEPGWKGMGKITPVSMDGLKHWLKNGDHTRPFNEEKPPATTTPLPTSDNIDAAAVTTSAKGAEPRIIAKVGATPSSATPLELRTNKDGTITPFHDGHEVLDFDSGQPVRLPKGVTDEAAIQAVKDSGNFGRRTRYFDAGVKTEPAPAPAAAKSPDSGVKPKGDRGSAVSDAFLARKAAEKAAAETQDRNGLREADRKLRDLRSSGGELAGQMRADVESSDHDPKEVMPALKEWAKQSNLPADDLRGEVLRQLRASDIAPKHLKAIEKALDPIAAAKDAKPLSDKQAFVHDYAAFDGRNVEQAVELAEGGTATLRVDAAKVMRTLDARMKSLRDLRACIEG